MCITFLEFPAFEGLHSNILSSTYMSLTDSAWFSQWWINHSTSWCGC
jgi:hypothetical protein